MTDYTAEGSSRAVGLRYEELAARYLTDKGYRILQRNYRCKLGEIDLIAKERGYLCFIEVKYRTNERVQNAAGAVNQAKQRRISRAAAYYLAEKGYCEDTPCRFDVVGITPEKIQVIRNAFTYRG